MADPSHDHRGTGLYNTIHQGVYRTRSGKRNLAMELLRYLYSV